MCYRYYGFIRLPAGLAASSAPPDLPYRCSQQVLLRLATGARLIPQDLPSSLFQPTSGSCRLYNGRRAASSQVPAALITPPPHEVILPDDLAISLLHQRFICIHLPDAYLPPQDGFSLTVHHHHLTATAA